MQWSFNHELNRFISNRVLNAPKDRNISQAMG